MNNFSERLMVSLIITALIFLVIYFSTIEIMRPIFTLVVAGALSVALWEFYHIAKKKGYLPLSGLGIIGSIAYFYAIHLGIRDPSLDFLPYAIPLLMLAMGFLYFFFFGDRPLVNLAVTFFGLIYLTLPLGLIILINFEYGRSALVYLILITKLTDTGAYFTGKKWGRLKLAPYISPNKTWEGALGGFILGVVASLVLAPFMNMHYGTALILGAILALASIFGDLTESLLKRDLGVKDSSHLPGLGGFLDVVDSLVFTTPLMYFYLKFGVHPL